MWWPTQARDPRATQNVFFSSAPHASSGRSAGTGRRSASGTKPRERRTVSRRGPAARSTESSTRVSIGRSCGRNRSAMPASRSRASASSNAIGSSDTLPLVITRSPPAPASSRWWSGVYGSITPRSGERGATASATRASGRRRAIRIGRSRPSSTRSSSSVSSTSRRAVSIDADISANGRSSRCLRERSRATAVARRRPGMRGGSRRGPSPPRSRRRRGRRHATRKRVIARGTRPSRSVGPQSGHAFGCAWKRRSSGSRYSARQRSHISNPAIVVSSRSYGTPRTIVNRGPQFVQFVNG